MLRTGSKVDTPLTLEALSAKRNETQGELIRGLILARSNRIALFGGVAQP